MPIHHLHEPVDVFSEWLDDCEAAAQGKPTGSSAAHTGVGADGIPQYESESDDDLGEASGVNAAAPAAAAAATTTTQRRVVKDGGGEDHPILRSGWTIQTTTTTTPNDSMRWRRNYHQIHNVSQKRILLLLPLLVEIITTSSILINSYFCGQSVSRHPCWATVCKRGVESSQLKYIDLAMSGIRTKGGWVPS
jgi:hypothetical protein